MPSIKTTLAISRIYGRKIWGKKIKIQEKLQYFCKCHRNYEIFALTGLGLFSRPLVETSWGPKTFYLNPLNLNIYVTVSHPKRFFKRYHTCFMIFCVFFHVSKCFQYVFGCCVALKVVPETSKYLEIFIQFVAGVSVMFWWIFCISCQFGV